MKKFLSLLRNNIFILFSIIIYICFRPLWENLFIKWINQPILSQFSSDWSTTVLFIISALGILAYHIVSIKQKEIRINKKTIGTSLVILFVWGYYRFTTNTAFHLEMLSSLCYVDIIPILSLHISILYGNLRKVNKPYINNTNGFLIDRPITQTAHDLLNRTKDAQDSVNRLMATNTDNEAFTFGIIASWGEGKTSFMALMEEYFSQAYKDKVIIMKFNPWIYRKESNLTHIFLEDLSQTLIPYSTELSKGLLQYAKMFLAIDNEWIKTLTNFFISLNSTTTFEQFTLLKENIKKINKKIVVFIDDIDRLSCDEIEEILRLVRNTSNLPNMYFILAYDKKYVIDTLNKQYKTHSIKYMDKILQEEFVLPAVNENLLKDLLLQYLKNELDTNEYNKIEGFLNDNIGLTQIAPLDYIKTIRDAKRITNQLIFSIRKIHDEVDICDFLTLELFRLRYPFVVNLFIEKKDEILIYQPNLQKMVYFNGKNAPETNKYASIFGKKEYFNFMEYITNHYHKLYLNENDIDTIGEFINALFGEHKSQKIGSINNPNYMNRFFRYSILDSEVSEKEWNELKKLPFEEMKPTIKKWMTNRSISLKNRIEKEQAKNKEEIYKLLHLVFYVGSLDNYWVTHDLDIIHKLLKYLFYLSPDKKNFSEEDRKVMHICLTENGINIYQLHYLYSLFEDGFYNDNNILTKEEVIELQNNLFKQYIQEGKNSINDIWECWLDTSHQETISMEGGKRKLEHFHAEESNQLMRDYVIKHIEEFIPKFIVVNHVDTSKFTIQDAIKELWGSYEAFYEYINNINNDSPILSEFKKFLAVLKKENYNIYVSFTFNHIKM